jgi:hypothetical protein
MPTARMTPDRTSQPTHPPSVAHRLSLRRSCASQQGRWYENERGKIGHMEGSVAIPVAKSDPAPFVATVGYVRSLGIRTLCAYCQGKREGAWPCHHAGQVDVSEMPDETPLASIERRLVCTACGAIGAVDARPDWSELHSSDPRPNWMASR